MSGNVVLADVRSNGLTGAERRWLLRVAGWEWRVSDGGYHHAKAFLTRAGAEIEAEDIISSAASWR